MPVRRAAVVKQTMHKADDHEKPKDASQDGEGDDDRAYVSARRAAAVYGAVILQAVLLGLRGCDAAGVDEYAGFGAGWAAVGEVMIGDAVDTVDMVSAVGMIRGAIRFDGLR